LSTGDNRAGCRDEVLVLAAARSPVAVAGGGLAGLSVDSLAAHAIAAAVERAGVDGGTVDELRLGCADPWSSADIARAAAAAAGLPNAAANVASAGGAAAGLAALIGAFEAIRSGAADVVVACGVESMSQLAGAAAPEVAEAAPEAAAERVEWSQSRWLAAHERGTLADEVVPLGTVVHDDHPRPDGAADGAAALVLASARAAARRGAARPLARVLGSATVAGDGDAGSGPADAVARLLGRLGIRPEDVVVAEIDEPSGPDAVLLDDAIALDRERINVNGGTLAIGRPLGMSGARLAVTLAHELNRRGAGVGIAAADGDGAGQALALAAIEGKTNESGALR
jgi:acetyl-CoA acetyltransferase